MKVCFFCGKEFEPKIDTDKAKFCSTKCKSAVYYKKYYTHFAWKNKRNCVYCGKEFLAPSINSKYCSESHRKYHYKKRNWEKIKADQRAWFKKARLEQPERFRQFARSRNALRRSTSGSGKSFSKAFPLKVWEEMKDRQNYACLICGLKEPEIKLTIDHIIPLSKGGIHGVKNIQAICHGCNSRKKDHLTF